MAMLKITRFKETASLSTARKLGAKEAELVK